MARQVNLVLRKQWRQRLKMQRESGLSITQFCREENLSPHTFHAWRRKLRQAVSRPQPTTKMATIQSSRQRRGAAARYMEPVSFAASSATGFLQLPLAPAPQSPWIELVLADGTVVRVPQQNIAAVLAVLRVLRGESCSATLAERDDA